MSDFWWSIDQSLLMIIMLLVEKKFWLIPCVLNMKYPEELRWLRSIHRWLSFFLFRFKVMIGLSMNLTLTDFFACLIFLYLARSIEWVNEWVCKWVNERELRLRHVCPIYRLVSIHTNLFDVARLLHHYGDDIQKKVLLLFLHERHREAFFWIMSSLPHSLLFIWMNARERKRDDEEAKTKGKDFLLMWFRRRPTEKKWWFIIIREETERENDL